MTIKEAIRVLKEEIEEPYSVGHVPYITATQTVIDYLELQIDTKCSDIVVQTTKTVDSVGKTTQDCSNEVNLCDFCKQTYPECQSMADKINFCDGKGDEGDYACALYEPKHYENGFKICKNPEKTHDRTTDGSKKMSET